MDFILNPRPTVIADRCIELYDVLAWLAVKAACGSIEIRDIYVRASHEVVVEKVRLQQSDYNRKNQGLPGFTRV